MLVKNRLITSLIAFFLLFFVTQASANSTNCLTPIVINEFVASNASTLADEDGDYEDWIELYNCSDAAIDLSGWGLSDNQERPFKWVFKDTVIQPKEHLLIWASGKDRQQPGLALHTNFKISASGEPLLLTRSDGAQIDAIDAVKLSTDISFGRDLTHKNKNCFFKNPTPGKENDSFCFDDARLGTPVFSLKTGVYKNEIEISLSSGINKESTILYTLDGSKPSLGAESTLVYMEPIKISKSDDPLKINTVAVNSIVLVSDISFRFKLENRFYSSINYLISFTNRVVWFVYRAVRKITGYQNDYFKPITFNSFTLHNPTESYGGTAIESYAVLSETQFDNSLPFLFINNDELAGVESRDEWVMGHFTLNESDGRLEIKGRGNSTWGMPKKPYSLKLETPSPLLGMESHHRWVLLQNYMDRTLLRNKVSLEISKRLDGLVYTTESQFVELVLNGVHLGNYQLTEQIQIHNSRLNIETSSIDNNIGGHLILLDINNPSKRQSELSWKSPIIETAKRNPNWDTLPYSLRRTLSKDPVTAKKYLEAYITEIETLLMSDFYGSDSILYSKFIDIDSFIDYYILFELVRNGEPNHPKSVFMYQAADGKIHAGPAWDFDWGTFRGYSGWTIRDTLWYSRLFLDPYFVERFKQRWNEALPKLKEIPDFIDDQYNHLAFSAKLNDQLWDISERTTNRDESMSFEEAIENMKDTYIKRLSWMNNEISSW